MKQKSKRPLCFDCKYFYPDQGTGNGCLKVLHKHNPFKKTIWNTGRWEKVVKESKDCKYYKLK